MIISLVPTVVACSGGQAQKSKSKPEPVTFTISMGEYTYEPDTIQVKVGQDVTLKLVNNGALAHELMIGRDVTLKDGRPNGYTVDLFESTNVEPMIMGETMDMSEEMEDDEEHKDDEAMDEEEMDMGEEMKDDDEHKGEEQTGDETMDDEAMDDEHQQHMGTMVLLKNTGEEASITFVVTEDMVGEWEIGCFELDGVHYDAGMKGKLVVKSS